MTAWVLLVAVLLLAANAFFVAAEFAAVGARRTLIEQWAEAGGRRAEMSLGAIRALPGHLTAAQLGIAMASLGLGFVAEPAVAAVLEDALDAVGFPQGLVHAVSFGVALAIVVLAHTVLGEMVPKNLALAGAERTLLVLVVPMVAFLRLFAPIIWVLNGAANGVLRLFRVEPVDEKVNAVTHGELAVMVQESHDEGLIEAQERARLAGALAFRETTVDAVMAPIVDVDAVPRLSTVSEIEAALADTNHTRLPIYGDDLDDVLGFVHAKDLLDVAEDARARPISVQRIRPILRVPTGTVLPELLVAMKSTRTHLAVVHAHGRTVGVVRLDDVLEALVSDSPAPST